MERDARVCGWEYVGFEYAWPHHIHRTQWHHAESWLYFAYRAAIALYFLGWLLYNADESAIQGSGPYFFIYLTNWSFVLFNAYLCYGAILAFPKWKWNQFRPEHKMSLGLKVHWFLYNIAVQTAIAVTILYWTLVYRLTKGSPSAMNLHHHLINGIVGFIDIFIIRMPHRPLHFWVPMSYGLLYAVFNASYYLAGGHDQWGHDYIYPSVNYSEKPVTAVIQVVVVPLVGIPVWHQVIYAIYRLRLFLHARFHLRTNTVDVSREGEGFSQL